MTRQITEELSETAKNWLHIVEEKDASPAQKKIKEVNAGIYCLNWQKIKPAFSQLQATTLKANTI